MENKLYVGNLPYSSTEDSLSELFGQCGSVSSTKIITDRETGRSKGFGFVEMSSESEAVEAIDKFNGQEIDGRSLKVSLAKPMAPKRNFNGPRGGGGGGGNRY